MQAFASVARYVVTSALVVWLVSLARAVCCPGSRDAPLYLRT